MGWWDAEESSTWRPFHTLSTPPSVCVGGRTNCAPSFKFYWYQIHSLAVSIYILTYIPTYNLTTSTSISVWSTQITKQHVYVWIYIYIYMPLRRSHRHAGRGGKNRNLNIYIYIYISNSIDYMLSIYISWYRHHCKWTRGTVLTRASTSHWGALRPRTPARGAPPPWIPCEAAPATYHAWLHIMHACVLYMNIMYACLICMHNTHASIILCLRIYIYTDTCTYTCPYKYTHTQAYILICDHAFTGARMQSCLHDMHAMHACSTHERARTETYRTEFEHNQA